MLANSKEPDNITPLPGESNAHSPIPDTRHIFIVNYYNYIAI